MNNSVNVYGGQLTATGLKIGIVCSRFNEFFVSKLLDGAIDTIVRHGGDAASIDVVWVPGSYEIPLTVQKLADSGRYDALVAIGVVIKGATAHADYINSEVAKGLSQVSMKTGVPVAYGVVTTENIEQAIERAGCKAGNRGADAAITAIEMANLVRLLPKAAVAKVAVATPVAPVAPVAAPKKRGRPAKKAAVAVTVAAAPKKRGRPAKKTVVETVVELAKKRGRPSKKELRARKQAEKIAAKAVAIVAKAARAVETKEVKKVPAVPAVKTPAPVAKPVKVEKQAPAPVAKPAKAEKKAPAPVAKPAKVAKVEKKVPAPKPAKAVKSSKPVEKVASAAVPVPEKA